MNTSSEAQDNGFVLFVFYNAGPNTRNVDGHGIFHVMGEAQCVTPSSAAQTSSCIPRPKIKPTANVVECLDSFQLLLTTVPRTID
ncbi:hypothetical protein AVEN_139697-1 [Araneus ventricosus]|uniref:Uncharacterized protein n=1 Tax=Araneus ventricosus TaxID=182803 RepID=A0A4Y2V489_ARAVE|nr:hypothetical protein AVEN_139697-1 [Araneus ventricosus]